MSFLFGDIEETTNAHLEGVVGGVSCAEETDPHDGGCLAVVQKLFQYAVSEDVGAAGWGPFLSLIRISEPTRLRRISYAVCGWYREGQSCPVCVCSKHLHANVTSADL